MVFAEVKEAIHSQGYGLLNNKPTYLVLFVTVSKVTSHEANLLNVFRFVILMCSLNISNHHDWKK